MKLKSTIYGLAMGALMGGIFVSCSNELSDSYYEGAGQMRIIRAPEVTAWSGNQILGNNDFGSVNSALGTRTNLNELGEEILSKYESQYIKKIDAPNAQDAWQKEPFKLSEWTGTATIETIWPLEFQEYFPLPSNDRIDGCSTDAVPQAEADYVINWIKNHPNSGSQTCGLVNYYVRNVGSSFDEYDLNNSIKSEKGFNHMDKLQISGKEIPDYNSVKSGARMLLLNFEVTGAAYHETYGQDFVVDAYRFYYIQYPEGTGPVNCYLGFDYRAEKNTQGSEEPVHYQGDNVFNDWVLKFIAADGNLPIPDDADVDGDGIPDGGNTGGGTKTTCDKCGDDLEKHDDNGVCSDCEGKDTPCSPCPNDETCEHPKGSHDEDNGYCSKCNQGEDCGRPAPTNNPNKVVSHMNEVEVNFSINDLHKDANGGANYNIEDLVTKLSIHVRYAGDIEIFIPIGAQYQCAADDLYILKDHYAGNNSYGSKPETSVEGQTTHTLTYNVFTDAEHGEHEVILRIVYEEGGIRVTTDGITEEIINYCKENFGDGINFEIYNYFCNNQQKADGTWERVTGEAGNLEIQALYEMLNEETWIKFLDGEPDYYINAFGYEMDKKDPNFSESQRMHDIIVKIIEEQASEDYEPNGQGYHLNGTPYNDVWVKKGVTADEAHPGRVATSHQ